MSSDKLNIGVLGLDRRGQLAIRAVSELSELRICAVADRDTQKADKAAALLECEAYDDYRQFIIQGEFDCLFVIAGLHSCLEFVRMALKEGINVLKLAPMARDFEEASSLTELAESQRCRFDIADPGSYVPSFNAFRDVLQQYAEEKPFLIRLFCDVGLLPGEDPVEYQIHPDTQDAWITDQELAGGGVLLHNCYHLIGHLISCFGLPQQVYFLCNSLASDRQQLHHLSEDTALVTMRFGENLIAELVAIRHWDDRQREESLTLHHKERRIEVTLDRLSVFDGQGSLLNRTKCDFDELNIMQTMLSDYAASMTASQEHKFASTGKANLKVMAVMQAAYLSSKTGTPEDPERILGMTGH
jgi:predicted dehydrogenase